MSSINPLNNPLFNLINPTPPIPLSGPAATSDSIAQAAQALQALFPSSPVLPIAKYYSEISTSLRQQKLQEILAKFADAESRRELFAAASNEAQQISELLRTAQDYEKVQQELESLNIDQQVITVNNAIDTYNNGADPSQITLLNQAISDYETAESTYRASLSTYSDGLANYESAQTIYQEAVSDWNDALLQYQQDGNQSALDAARATFDAAQANFDVAQTDFNNYQLSLDATEADFEAAKSQLETQTATYNAYIDQRNLDTQTLNTALSDWNQIAGQASEYIDGLNDLASRMDLESSLVAPPQVVLVPEPSHYLIPNGSPDPLKDGVQNTLDALNGSISLQNDFITNTVNPNTVIANNTADPDYTPLNTLSIIDNLSTLPANLSPLTQVSQQPTYPTVNYTAPPHIDILDSISTVVVTLAVAIEIALEPDTDKELDETPFAKRRQRLGVNNFLGGSGASTALTTLNQDAAANNPYLGSVLSRQAFEAFFNQYGVPIGSMLVDQIGAQVTTFRSRINLVAAANAQRLLGGAALSGPEGQESARLALGLGSLQAILDLNDSGIQKRSLQEILVQSPLFLALPPEKQEGLLNSLTNEITAGELKESLPSLGPRFAGLLPQILLAVETPTGSEGVASIRGFLFQIINLAKGLTQTFGLTYDKALELAKKSYQESLAQTGEAVRQSVIDAIVKNIDKSNADDREVRRRADIAYENGQNAARAQAAKDADARKNAFTSSFMNSITSGNIVDPTQAQRLYQQFQNSPENDLGKIALNAARQFNIDAQDLKEILAVAERSRMARLSALNPIGSFILHHIAPPGELSVAFVQQAKEVLTPTIGPAKAQQSAAAYADLIFKGPNSVIGRLQNNERQLNQAIAFDQDARLFEDYLNATESLRSPDTAQGSFRNLGEVLLMTAMAAGPSSAGTTSEDNALGPLANRNKRPIDIPI